MIMNRVNPEMLSLAREVRGWTQTDLATRIGVDQSQISRYERGVTSIPSAELHRLAEALSFPVDFFFQEGKRHGASTGEILHRRRQSVSASKLREIDALSDIYWLAVKELIKDIDAITPYDIPTYRTLEFNGDVEQIAQQVRADWEMPAGPVDHVIRRLEEASCFIFVNDFETNEIDETVQWIRPSPPIIVINSRSPGDRLRFSLAHALGHLVMHQGMIPTDEMEDEADQFASAFLMPEDDIRSDLEIVTIEHMLQKKRKWKVSMQALIHRARDIGSISERRYRSLFQMLSRAGYRKQEPFPIEPERPSKVRELINFYKDAHDVGTNDVIRDVHLRKEDFFNWMYPELSEVP